MDLHAVVLLTAAALGLLIALYFTALLYGVISPETPYMPQFCRLDDSTCGLVLRHPDASLFGVPNSLLGILYYTAIALDAVGILGQPLARVLVYASWLSVGVAGYLIYSLMAKIRVTCRLCLVAHLLNGAIALLLTFGGRA